MTIETVSHNALYDLRNVVEVRNGPVVSEVVRGKRWFFQEWAHDCMFVGRRECTLRERKVNNGGNRW
jgi:hypothetical protein